MGSHLSQEPKIRAIINPKTKVGTDIPNKAIIRYERLAETFDEVAWNSPIYRRMYKSTLNRKLGQEKDTKQK